jgi:large subunit ribosomal protein L1
MASLGKRLKHIYKGLDQEKIYDLDSAIKFIKDFSKASKFDETLELALNLGIDARQSDQMVRGTVSLPHGTGKVVRVAVFARGEKADEAKSAGADLVGAEELADNIQKGELGFDRCIATPDMMGVVGRLGKVLGPKGLMPNPKLGTVTVDVASAVKAAKAGQIEFRSEKEGIIHSGIGKVSFTDLALKENLLAVIDAVVKAKPANSKGSFLKKASLSSTMGPGLQIDVNN